MLNFLNNVIWFGFISSWASVTQNVRSFLCQTNSLLRCLPILHSTCLHMKTLLVKCISPQICHDVGFISLSSLNYLMSTVVPEGHLTKLFVFSLKVTILQVILKSTLKIHLQALQMHWQHFVLTGRTVPSFLMAVRPDWSRWGLELY